MFSFAILLGIYSYIVFALGLLGILHKSNVIIATLVFWGLVVFFNRTKIKVKKLEISRDSKLILWLIVILGIINLIGALGPELSFDALWYHLTLPKIFLEQNRIFFIPGGLFYYSVMPMLGEMLFVGGLSFGGEVVAKLINFSFGIITCIALYKISRNFFDRKFSLLVVLAFYSNLVLAWQSITAYIDLTRTFFEAMALWGFVNYLKTKERKWITESAIMTGLAISTKLLALGSLFVFAVLIAISEKKISKNVFIFILVGLIVALPYFSFSYINTGNPVYPFFTKFYGVGISPNLFNPIKFLTDSLSILTRSADPISPIYLIFLPVIFYSFKRFSPLMKFISLYCLLTFITWYFTPRTGGGRFLMPYLPAFSLITVYSLTFLGNNLKKFSIYLIIFITLISIVFRWTANYKFIKPVLGLEKRNKFLSENLNFNYGDFYDTDNYFKKNIKPGDKVLLFGFHNLYYADFPFLDSSYIKKGDTFNYIAVQKSEIPQRFKFWNLIYSNKETGVRLYSTGGQKWVY